MMFPYWDWGIAKIIEKELSTLIFKNGMYSSTTILDKQKCN